MSNTFVSYKQKLLDPRWQKKRLEVLNRKSWSCQICGESKKPLHVHHLCYSDTYNPWDVEDSALQSLCEDCHKIKHLTNLSDFEKKLISVITHWADVYDGKDLTTSLFVREINKIILKEKT